MKNIFKRKEKKHRGGSAIKRNFSMAQTNRLFGDWNVEGMGSDINALLFSKLELIRKRARDLEVNSPWARRFFSMAKTNIVGPTGFRLSAQGQSRTKKPDTEGNMEIERLWKVWASPENCTMSGTQSLIDFCNLAVLRMLSDGEFILRKIEGADNEFGFALAPLPIDRLNQNKNRVRTSTQNAIIMGVEIDEWGKPIKYYFQDPQQNDVVYNADEIIHLFPRERVGQTRGFPFIISGGARAKMLNAFEDAVVTNKRIAASKMGFFIQDPDNPPASQYEGDGENADGSTRDVVEPGVMEALPAGYKGFEAFDPADAGDGFKEFSEQVLRSLASAWNVNYNTLANDLTGVNYSSIRHGAIEDRDAWMCMQQFIIDHLLKPIYKDWLKWALTKADTFLSATSYKKFMRISFYGRRWDWIDPLKEEAANNKGLINNSTSEIAIARKSGRDFEDIVAERVRAKELLEKAGLAVVGAKEEVEVSNAD